jgi:CubicO group peptidase (beta-lactamase class C family)
MRKILAAIAMALVSSTSSFAATPPPTQHPLTHDDVEAYLDGFFPDAMTRADIAGAVVVVVKDGRVLLAKGYGYSDLEARKPVDPASTLFRPGSISKLFTWTAVMQLVEQHKLDLDRDVNDYLDFKIPGAFGRPITLRNLMTHTAGFEEHLKGLMVEDPARFRTLRDALANGIPKRIYPPGEVSAYSNYGASLAGYVVQRVSGERFEDYITHHIFAPLGMHHATFAQPLPKALAGDMSKGYIAPEDGAQPFEFISLSPAGGLSASGESMARFMIAHLNHGAFGTTAILKPETADLMHRAAFSPTPPLPAMALGFYHEDRNGLTIIGHDGDSQQFHSELALVLEKNVGLYVSLNSAGHETSPISGLRTFLLKHFVDRYFPAPELAALPPPPLTAASDAARIAGVYRLSRRSDSNFMSVSSLTLPIIVAAHPDGSISFPTLASVGVAGKWSEIAPFVWREEHGARRFVARVENGAVRWLGSDLFPPILVLEPIPFWKSFLFVLPVLGASLLMLALTALFWPIKAMLRWRYREAFPFSGREATLYRLTRVVALLFVATFAGWFFFLISGQVNLGAFDTPSDPYVRILQLLSIIAIMGTVVSALEFRAALRDAKRFWWTKATDGLNALACIALSVFLISYNFITLSLNY